MINNFFIENDICLLQKKRKANINITFFKLKCN